MNSIKAAITKISIITVIVSALTMTSCGGKISDNPEGFKQVDQELKNKFGIDAFYTNISISYTPQIGLLFDAIVTNSPSSLKLEEWNWAQNNWIQKSEVTLEITGGEPEDFMFNITDKPSIIQLGELITASKKKLKKEKKIDTVLLTARIDSPDNGDKSKMVYNIALEPENGGTTFHFTYDLGGNLKDFTY